MLWRALKNVESGFYIDVGAQSPDFDSVTRSFYERGWFGINIEPSAAYHSQLKGKRPRDINLNFAAGEKAETRVFHLIDDTGLSTMNSALAEQHASSGLRTRKETVEVLTLAEICRLHAAKTIHFLKIDVEGFEEQVLKGADFQKFRPWIVIVEATEPNSQHETYQEWEPLLLAAEYKFVWFDGLNRFYIARERYDSFKHAFETPPNVFDAYVYPAPINRYELPVADTRSLEAVTPVSKDTEERIVMATKCRDADQIPKVPDAGTVRTELDGTITQIMHNGIKVLADGYYGEWMRRLISSCDGHHEPQEERMFYEVLKCVAPNASMIELGGYWSFYSLWFLNGSPERKAVVLEPDPLHLMVGRKNAELNGLNPCFFNGFVSCVSKPSEPFETEQSGVINLRGYSVSELMEANGLTTLDILHCDTQGAEFEMIKSCKQLFESGRIRWAFVSTHAHQITGDPLTHQRCLASLRDFGATIEAEHDVHESFSGDGLIVARFGPVPIGWNGPIAISHNRYKNSLFRNPAYDLAQAQHLEPVRHVFERLIKAAYRTILLRDPDPPSLNLFADALLNGGSVEELFHSLFNSQEFIGKQNEFLAKHVDCTSRAVPTSACAILATKEGRE